METRLHGNPDYGHLEVRLEAGEAVLAESGAMAWMDSGLELRARMAGGFLRALGRRFLGGESFFLAEYRAPAASTIHLAPSLPGSLREAVLGAEGIWVAPGAFLAAEPEIELRTRFLGWRGLFSGTGPFFLRLQGPGRRVVLASYGALVEEAVDGERIVDTGHLVAWEPGLDFRVTTPGGWKPTLFSGEGLLLRFRGRGRLWLQTRNLPATAAWLGPLLPA